MDDGERDMLYDIIGKTKDDKAYRTFGNYPVRNLSLLF
jgi:hypothetical protein